MRPPIRPGSALLQVDPDCTKSGVKIYVDAHNLAYNAVCNQFDIQTGVNKFWKIQLLQVLVRVRVRVRCCRVSPYPWRAPLSLSY